ncbi:50S ribosomal protein L9 [bacterium]|nr:50S ribosomal protein L9 [bacterium]
MKVVLLDDVVNVGVAGDIVEVKNGYARNWLIPKRYAELATKDAVNRIKLIKRAAETKRARRMKEASDKFDFLGEKQIVIAMKSGTENRLFGAVTSAMIADEIKIQHDVDVERRHIHLDEPIKQLGEFEVELRAGADVTGKIKVVIEPLRKSSDFEQELLDKIREEQEARDQAERDERRKARKRETDYGDGEYVEGSEAHEEEEEPAVNAEADGAAQAEETQEKYEAHEKEDE